MLTKHPRRPRRGRAHHMGGPTNSEFPMPRWLAVRGFTCLEVLLRSAPIGGGQRFSEFRGRERLVRLSQPHVTGCNGGLESRPVQSGTAGGEAGR
jgi:hypothetical protein